MVDYLNIVAVKADGRVKRYEISPVSDKGFYRISTDTVEKVRVYFPGRMTLEEILADIRKADEE